MFFVSDALLDQILTDDIPYGDATTALFGIEKIPGIVRCRPKAETTIAGVALAERLFARVGLQTTLFHEEGDTVAAGIFDQSDPFGDRLHRLSPRYQSHGIDRRAVQITARTRRILQFQHGISGYRRGGGIEIEIDGLEVRDIFDFEMAAGDVEYIAGLDITPVRLAAIHDTGRIIDTGIGRQRHRIVRGRANSTGIPADNLAGHGGGVVLARGRARHAVVLARFDIFHVFAGALLGLAVAAVAAAFIK